jgi:hypothetical protein
MPAFARAQLHQICHWNATEKTHECLYSATVACRLERSVSRACVRKIFHARVNFFTGLDEKRSSLDILTVAV